MIEICKPSGVDPQGYLADAITRIIQGHHSCRLDELVPWAEVAPVGVRSAPTVGLGRRSRSEPPN